MNTAKDTRNLLKILITKIIELSDQLKTKEEKVLQQKINDDQIIRRLFSTHS